MVKFLLIALCWNYVLFECILFSLLRMMCKEEGWRKRGQRRWGESSQSVPIHISCRMLWTCQIIGKPSKWNLRYTECVNMCVKVGIGCWNWLRWMLGYSARFPLWSFTLPVSEFWREAPGSRAKPPSEWSQFLFSLTWRRQEVFHGNLSHAECREKHSSIF